MANKLFLLDGMALVYRAHFAFVNRPIYTSKGFNTSAIYGFTQTLLEILNTRSPTHLVVAFDTDAPTQRHEEFEAYKAQRESMPEELSDAIPHVRRMIHAFNIVTLAVDGWEADDVIGTLVKQAEGSGFDSYMVTPDKDFSQLVSPQTFLYKPSRMGDSAEIVDLPATLAKWGIEKPEQVIDILGLWGDASDNIPGVPGIGEKTAIKLISQYGSIENLLAHTDDLKGKLKENLETHREQALLCKRLATIQCSAPVPLDLDTYELGKRNDDELKALCVEFEFNTIGKRLFGQDFQAGRGFHAAAPVTRTAAGKPKPPPPPSAANAQLKRLADTDHDYQIATSEEQRRHLATQLAAQSIFSLSVHTPGEDPKHSPLTGIAFSWKARQSVYLPLPKDAPALAKALEPFHRPLDNPKITVVGHDLKLDLCLLKHHGLDVRATLFDTMLAHSLVEPDMRHALGYLSQSCLGYQLLTDHPPPSGESGETPQATPIDLPGLGPEIPLEQRAKEANERADIAGQLHRVLQPLLREKKQEKVFYEIEAPLIRVLVDMEYEGIRLDSDTLAEFGRQLAQQLASLERTVHGLAGREFNLNSPKQLGEVLFDELKLIDKPKKTRTGQYATNEQTLLSLAPEHEIVRKLLEYRAATKLKSTYVDTLPLAVSPRTARIHTTYQQLATATGRLNSQNPNLQNIPIRTEQGQEIRKAFVPRDEQHALLSADYSQIELRIIAALTGEKTMLDAFETGDDIHTATAARVYQVGLEDVTPEMRRKAKMVNYGIAYGISAFGLAQRLGIPRHEAAAIIDQYFAQFPGVAKYMEDTIAFCREHGFVETITGRRRYLRDINSSNGTIRSSAERNAINAPIQGTAADMIKLAMIRIHRDLEARPFKTRLLLQVHDELVFDLHLSEERDVVPMIEGHMRNALPLPAPIVVDIGRGRTWLEAH